MKNYIIYKITNKTNNKIYIGKYTGLKFEKYWGSGTLISRAIAKYGIENFSKEILEECNKINLNEREIYWISICDSTNKKIGYNILIGGAGGDTSKFIDYDSPIFRKKKSDSLKKYYKSLTDEERKIRSEKVSGSKNGMFGKTGYWKGKKMPKELVARMMANRKSFKGDQNPNWKGGIVQKYCKCGKQMAVNSKTCNACRPRSKENNPFYGKTHSQESIDKIKKAIKLNRGEDWLPGNARKVIIEGKLYNSVTEAANDIGIGSPLLIYRIKSENEKYKNYNY